MANLLLYGVTVLVWGSTWFAITFQLGVVAVDVSVAYRYGLAAAVLLAWCILRWRRLRFGARDHAFMAVQGVLLFSASFILAYLAVGYLTSGLVAMTFSTLVYLNVVNGALFLGAPIQRRVLLAGAAGLVGMTVLFWPEVRAFNLSSDEFAGLGLGLLATLCVSFGQMVAARNQMRGLPILETNAFSMAYGALFTAAIALARGVPFEFDDSVGYIASLIYLAVFGTVIGFGCFLTLLGRIGADRSAYVMVMFPVVALGISTLFEGFTWSATAFTGVGLILLGNVLVLTKLGREPAIATPNGRRKLAG